MIVPELIAGGSILLGVIGVFSWLLDRLCARWYGGLTGSQLVPPARESAEWAAVWSAVNGADGPSWCDPYIVKPRSEGEGQ